MHTTVKRVLALCGMVVMLVLVASITVVPAHAAANGIYTATATPHYRNPSTGVIEDTGGSSSEVLGQSMTESATHRKALVEVDENGNTYVTVRLKLQDSVNSVSFKVDGSSVSYTCMQENYSDNSADFRMRVNSENSLICVSMYVAPMGRDVVFFITLSGLQAGSGDFVTSITVAPPAPETKPEEPKQEPQSEPQPETQPAQKPDAKPEQKPDAKPEQKPDTKPETKPADSKETEPEETPVSTEVDAEPAEATEVTTEPTATAEPKESTEPVGLQEFDASGNAVEEAETQSHGGSMKVALWVILGVAVAGGAGFCVWYFCFFKKKN